MKTTKEDVQDIDVSGWARLAKRREGGGRSLVADDKIRIYIASDDTRKVVIYFGKEIMDHLSLKVGDCVFFLYNPDIITQWCIIKSENGFQIKCKKNEHSPAARIIISDLTVSIKEDNIFSIVPTLGKEKILFNVPFGVFYKKKDKVK